jgi:hypothetical protein
VVNQAHIPSYVHSDLTLAENDNKSACLDHLWVPSPILERLMRAGISILQETCQIIPFRLSRTHGDI